MHGGVGVVVVVVVVIAVVVVAAVVAAVVAVVERAKPEIILKCCSYTASCFQA